MIWFFVLFTLTVITAWKVYSFFSFENAIKQTSSTKISKENSIKELASILKLEKDDNLFTVGLPPINNTLYVNPQNKTLLFQSKPSEKQVTFEYESINGLIKKVKEGSEKPFDDFINTNFQIPNYSQLQSDAKSIQPTDVLSVGALIGADSDYTQQIATKSAIDIRTILLSLIYNTVYSGNSGQIATAIENKKLKNITDKNYKIDKVNTELLAESLTKLKSDAGNDRTKFIESEYNKLHPTNESIYTGKSDNTLQVSIQKYLRTKAVLLDTIVRFDFTYINFRKDIFYCGEKSYKYSASTFYAVDNSELDYLFAKQFALPNYKSLSALEITSRIGIPTDSLELLEENSNSQIAFRAILNYILNNPSVYCIYNSKLQSPFSIKSDAIQYGKFDTDLLKNGIQNLSQDNFGNSEYSIIKKDRFTPIIIYTTLFFLFLSYFVIYFLYRNKQKAIVEQDIIPTGNLDEKLIMQKEKYEILIQKNKNEILNNTVAEITQFLSRPGRYLEYENDTLLLYRHKINFYNELERCKNSAELVKKIEFERTRNQNIPKVVSVNDLFEEANSRTDKIFYLLGKFDEYSKNVSKEKKKLSEEFQENERAKKSSDKLNTLLTDNYQGDFYDYLKEQITRIENDPSIKSFVRFGLLFKSSNQSKSKSESEILKKYNETNDFIDGFYRKYQKINEPKLLERTALLCWSMELADNLLKIRNEKLNPDFEKIKQDQLQLVSTRYFIHNARNQNKTLDDFEISIIQGNERIAEYNNMIADSISKLKIDNEHSEYINVLKDLMRKIKKYETSELVFKKLYEHFVSDFLDKVENLKFNEREVLAEDRSWLFQQLFNIAFHTADYVEYFIKEDDIKYHSNFLFLKNDFDLTKTEHRPFVENDMEQSTRVTNTVVKAARFAGVKKLDLLINKYYIKPEQLSQ